MPLTPLTAHRCAAAAEIKVIIIGNGGVGKSSMMRSFCKNGEFTGEYKKTIGTDFMRKEIYLDSIGEEVSMHIWDTAGQEEFSKLTRNYYKGAQACVLAFSTTDRDSFNAVPRWMEQAKATIPNDIAWALVQNKCDLMQEQQEFSTEEAEAMATKLGVRFYRMSVKDNMMVEDVFKYLAESAYEIMKRPSAPAPAPVAGGGEALVPPSAGGAAEPSTVKLEAQPKLRTGGKKGCC